MQKEGKVDELIKTLSEGAYGCIFIKGQVSDTNTPIPKYIIKVQKKKSTSINEAEISKRIMTIKHYDNYFAAVVKSERINIAKMKDDEIEQCEFLHTDTKDLTYESNKILYIGKYTLANYLTKIASMKPEHFVLTLIECNIILLEGLQKLVDAGIIHYNLRESNIMIRETNNRPIIVDFGISIDGTVEIKPTSFYIYYNEYAPWCIDIVVVSFIVNELGADWKTKTATIAEMTRLVDEYIKQNSGIKTLLFPDEIQALKTTLIDFFNKYDNKPWQNVYDELLKLRNTWDNYALAVMYSTLFENLNLTQYVSNFPFLGEYKKLLKSIILSAPNERILPKDTIAQINKLFVNIQRGIYNKLEDTFAGKLRIPENIKELEKNVANATMADKETEKKVYE